MRVVMRTLLFAALMLGVVSPGPGGGDGKPAPATAAGLVARRLRGEALPNVVNGVTT
jgi:hypothetical protein